MVKFTISHSTFAIVLISERQHRTSGSLELWEIQPVETCAIEGALSFMVVTKGSTLYCGKTALWTYARLLFRSEEVLLLTVCG